MAGNENAIKRNFADQLYVHEHQFVTHIATWRSMPSPKQQEGLNATAERFGAVKWNSSSPGLATARAAGLRCLDLGEERQP